MSQVIGRGGGGGGGGGGGFALYLSPNSISSTYIGETAVAFNDLLA